MRSFTIVIPLPQNKAQEIRGNQKMHVEKVTHEYDTEAWRFALPRAAVFKGLPGPFPATQARPVIYSHCFLLLKKKKKKSTEQSFK